MRDKKSFVILGEIFTTKTALQSRIRNILYSYADNVYISRGDYDFMLAVLSLHPAHKLKIGAGVNAIISRQNPVYRNTRNFWVLRIDGSEADFSYTECLTNTSHEKRFYNACRVAVEPFTQMFKRDFFGRLESKTSLCEVTGEAISFTHSHVDHKYPNTFQKIVHDFIAEYSIDVAGLKISGDSDGVFQDAIADDEIKQKWVAYHNARAELRVVSPAANLGILNTIRRDPIAGVQTK